MPGSTTATFSLIVASECGHGERNRDHRTACLWHPSVSDPNCSNNTASVNTVVGTTAAGDLTVTNVASPNPVQAGNNITYTQVVTNTGAAAATEATFYRGDACEYHIRLDHSARRLELRRLPTDSVHESERRVRASSGTFTVIYKVTAGTANGTVITDTATVNAANQSFGANSATATDVVAAATQADVALATAASPARPLLPGNNITYTQTVTNQGPASATGLSFTEATPTNTTFESVLAPAGWTCTAPAVGGTGTVNCTNPTLAAGTSADIIVVVNVPSTVAAGTITANSSVTTTSSDPNAANNSTTVTTSVVTVCDLAVTNSGTPSPVRRRQQYYLYAGDHQYRTQQLQHGDFF